MKCRQFKRAIKSLICGEKADIEVIHQHLSQCFHCMEKYGHLLAIVRSAKTAPVPPVDADRWKDLSTQLHRRIRQAHPAPFPWWRSLAIAVGEWKLVRFRKAVASAALVVALGLGLLAFVSGLLSDHGDQGVIAEVTPTPPPTALPGLPPDMEDVISILGPDGFITGIFSGYIQAGDYIAGHELREDSILEALDFLLS